MLRIFGHFVPVSAVALGIFEILLMSLALYLLTAPFEAGHFWQIHVSIVPAQFSVGLSILATISMIAVGLYNYDVFLDARVMIIKILLALTLAAPVAAYGVVLGMAAVGYHWLQNAIIEANGGASSTLAEALGRDRKGMWSIIGYVLAVIAAFFEPLIAIGLYIALAAVWLIPDRRIERRLTETR